MDTIKSAVAQAVGEIFKRDGQVQPSTLVNGARPQDHPAHSAFEWDDSKAGEEYRLWQARQWIRRVEVVVEERQERLIHVPVVKVGNRATEAREGYYKPISVVVGNQDEFAAALSQAGAKLGAAKAAYEELQKVAQAHNRRISHAKAARGFALVEEALGEGKQAVA
jgi:hypothetical protein